MKSDAQSYWGPGHWSVLILPYMSKLRLSVWLLKLLWWGGYPGIIAVSLKCDYRWSCWRKSESESGSHSVMSKSLWSRRLHSPWNSLQQNVGVGGLSSSPGYWREAEGNLTTDTKKKKCNHWNTTLLAVKT